MNKLQSLNQTVREYNGTVARYTKTKSPEDKKLMEECLRRVKDEAEGYLNG